MSFFTFIKGFFGDNPDHYVEENGWEGLKGDLAVAAHQGRVTKRDAAELMQTYSQTEKNSNAFSKRVESGITLTPSDRNQTRDSRESGNDKTEKVIAKDRLVTPSDKKETRDHGAR